MSIIKVIQYVMRVKKYILGPWSTRGSTRAPTLKFMKSKKKLLRKVYMYDSLIEKVGLTYCDVSGKLVGKDHAPRCIAR